MVRWTSDGGYHTSRSSPILSDPPFALLHGRVSLSVPPATPPPGPFWDAEVFHGPDVPRADLEGRKEVNWT
ncbi:hypothetical protein BO94DRAFT_529900 [Aspergillus sclerotioniger CBS 115572]|uniref:Uncharacterized protein n=1 Tax=Aspergillus sclerotioniger CBS 115572 TaxID=1450535 RepID=A0A317XDB0_9EURO|nr:hypothetical protein BO94DRAFT_529900 [Aspergillus sclerotioniger CBS 115572]PWY96519.1 hypothetical protein BO94DRAFT_529900 [Aspergillus sclerotioniger CBS 115572]